MNIKEIIINHSLWLNDAGGERANLSGANLYRANLSGANLIKANLYGAYLYGANLSEVNLYGANLSEVNLYGSDLSGANLIGANLSGANLSEANLYGAYLSEAKNIFQFGPMPTSGRICVAVRNKENWMVQAGCFWGSLEEFEEKVKKEHNCHVYLGICETLKKM